MVDDSGKQNEQQNEKGKFRQKCTDKQRMRSEIRGRENEGL